MSTTPNPIRHDSQTVMVDVPTTIMVPTPTTVMVDVPTTVMVPTPTVVGEEHQVTHPLSFFNRQLDPNVDLPDPNAPALSAELARLAKVASSIGIRNFIFRLYVVPADQPEVPVDTWSYITGQWIQPLKQRLLKGVPIPPDAVPSPDTDSGFAIYQPDWDDGSGKGTGRLFEFWRMSSPDMTAPGMPDPTWGAKVGQTNPGDSKWYCAWGGVTNYLSVSPGFPVNRKTPLGALDAEASNWMASATSIPWLPGQITFEDADLGQIDHALCLNVPCGTPRQWRWPAQRTDGRNPTGAFLNGTATIPKWDGVTLIDQGTRFMLDPNYVIDRSSRRPPIMWMIEEALQRYGCVVSDTAGAVSFECEAQKVGDPMSNATNAWLAHPTFKDGSGKVWQPWQIGPAIPWGSLIPLVQPDPSHPSRAIPAP